mgnify:FL=1
MNYVFDIDGTICSLTEGDYENAKPFKNRIKKINKLYDDGHTIFFQTARGMGRSDNSAIFAERILYKFTKKQLTDWGVKFHRLFMGKPSGDIYIDDKGVYSERFFTDEES